jgi:uncharacterized protein GlcG (DUF336 family)
MHMNGTRILIGGLAVVALAVAFSGALQLPSAIAQEKGGARAAAPAPGVTAQSPSSGATASPDISAALAQEIIAAAAKKAQEMSTKMDIAVVDAGGNLKAFLRMDGAWLGSIDIAQRKARTARYFDMPTGDIGKLSQPGGPLYNIEHSNGGLITFPGGLPLKLADGTIIGAIGVSGSTVENDHMVAQAGAALAR